MFGVTNVTGQNFTLKGNFRSRHNASVARVFTPFNQRARQQLKSEESKISLTRSHLNPSFINALGDTGVPMPGKFEKSAIDDSDSMSKLKQNLKAVGIRLSKK